VLFYRDQALLSKQHFQNRLIRVHGNLVVDLKYSLEEKEKQLSQNQTIIFFSQTLSID